MTEASTAHTMSELQKQWAKARLGSQALGQPPAEMPITTTMPEFNEADEDKEMAGPSPGGFPFDDDSSSASSVSSTGTVIPSPGRALFARPQGFASRSMDPIPWTTYFERELFLKEEAGPDSGSRTSNKNKPTSITYHAYLTSPVGKGPLFVTHHGAGSSGLSFAVLSSEIRKRLPNAGILSLDARGHGSTTVTAASSVPGEGDETTGQAPPPLDLSLSTLASDLFTVIQLTRTAMHWPELPPIILVGHSLGGAVVTELAKSYRLGPSLLGYAVLDVVEGCAMDALQSMQTYLSTRPQGFASLKDGIDWHVRSRTIRNSTSARTSVPGLLAPVEELQRPELQQLPRGVAGTQGTAKPWRWKTDLAATQPFWEDWFVGLSKKFLEARGGKMLLLAGTDRLDTELTIGQMQGKYALQVFPEAGHFIHEDLPEKTAIALVDFHRRNDRSQLVLPPKVSDLLAQGKKV
ncbi:protein phosphatase methylesterase [Neurospora crassa]|nr:carboxylesterase-mitochondrial 37S ribosomal protein YmS2 [Neurospora crassa OR74A]EAA35911.2 protein phosphatase methylesterase 1 [Neurospora crassa OR74A]KHE81124.1 protein phosphatase methylesterase [Neurospora crassa]|eukprot:XP_965147.2 carboxylesterase-mitochondrial 37S ribosomal protein YmS2 [Neurospora crassa OR74A]